jgi:hypothetical protein
VNGAQFFMEHFGRHFAKPTGNALADANAVLCSSHAMAEGASRFVKGNHAVIRPSGSLLKAQMNVFGIALTERTFSDLILEALSKWSDEPVMFVAFDRVLFPVANLLVTYDLRRVRLCTPKEVGEIDGTRVLDATVPPERLNEAELRLRRIAKAAARREAAGAA